MRFALVEMKGLRSILVSSDISVDVETIISVYSFRGKDKEVVLRAKHHITYNTFIR